MAQQALPPREPSKRIRRENRRYPSRAPPDVKVEAEALDLSRSWRSAADGAVSVKLEHNVPSFDSEVQEQRSLQRAQAELTALLQQSGCTSAAELGIKYASMERRLAQEEQKEQKEQEEEEEEASGLWATLQNCRGVTKQKADDRYLQCMGLHQKVCTIALC
jgi:hypothetical protein